MHFNMVSKEFEKISWNFSRFSDVYLKRAKKTALNVDKIDFHKNFYHELHDIEKKLFSSRSPDIPKE
ncbi:MAG: hypothetical protein K8S87_01105 [Planctomycetes bacterium]|nr:hypothetical protein [Planctomycetota bacterium]